jgi:5-methylthioadenosine/S-adenosylhomocysteine deaminase
MKLKLIAAGYALPDARAPLATDFAIVVDGARILAAGDRAEMQRAFPATEIERHDHMLLLPSFVNSHDHGRGLGTAALGIPDAVLETWILGLRAQPAIPPYLAAAYDAARLLRSGVTATAHSHNPRNWRALHAESLETVRGYRDAGIRVAFHPPIVDQNNLTYFDQAGFAESLPDDLRPIGRGMLGSPLLAVDEYLSICTDLFERLHDADGCTVHVQVSPAGGQWCSDGLIAACAEWARARGTRMQMHLLETRFQRAYAQRAFGKSFPRHLDEIGALGPWTTLAHMVWADAEDFALLAERGVGVVHNPSSNLRLRSGIAPLTEMMRAGVRLGIGLDGHGLDDDQDYLREMRLARTLAAMKASGAGEPSARDVLAMATRGGAAVTFGPDCAMGALAEGQLADVVLIKPSEVMAWQIEHGEAAQVLLTAATREHVRHVLANGAWVVRDGVCVGVDEAALLREIVGILRSSDDAGAGRALDEARRIAPLLERHLSQRTTDR